MEGGLCWVGGEYLDCVSVVSEYEAEAQAIAVPLLVTHDAMVSVSFSCVVVGVEPSGDCLGDVSTASLGMGVVAGAGEVFGYVDPLVVGCVVLADEVVDLVMGYQLCFA